ncbi:SagB-type dehydrogenase family enzyme [Methanofollis sp. W23]|uniref:SagB/ThcOx family dehydrogenase n=1 Tax=Methanofollis sp. W23 TaxID=2817849 RepID=UPI001D2E0B06|nr:SagB/ThcOx family dehydrogenase [Methanofollis sp. W23]MBP2145269.1 SagB-type dehydrogenase family enzyme [Methanofollis sp. W23]
MKGCGTSSKALPPLKADAASQDIATFLLGHLGEESGHSKIPPPRGARYKYQGVRPAPPEGDRTNTLLVILTITVLGLVGLMVVFSALQAPEVGAPEKKSEGAQIQLPAPKERGGRAIEEVLATRRSVRDYAETPPGLDDLSQLLWAAQGVTDELREFRTAPSAGALYPLEVYVAVGEVTDLPAGVYRYLPAEHRIESVVEGDVRRDLSGAALNQSAVEDAAAVIAIAGVYERTTGKYGERGVRYVYMEAGHAAQNIYLQATSLGLGTVSIGAFDDDEVKRVLGMNEDERPLYLMPIGRVEG